MAGDVTEKHMFQIPRKSVKRNVFFEFTKEMFGSIIHRKKTQNKIILLERITKFRTYKIS